jgi:hypothetical protein
MAGRITAVAPVGEVDASLALAHGDAVEVYSWSRREWIIGRYELDFTGAPFIELAELHRRLRYEAALLMGLRRLLH